MDMPAPRSTTREWVYAFGGGEVFSREIGVEAGVELF